MVETVETGIVGFDRRLALVAAEAVIVEIEVAVLENIAEAGRS